MPKSTSEGCGVCESRAIFCQCVCYGIE